MSLSHTRAIVRAALDGTLANVDTVTHPVFGVEMPTAVPGVPAAVLDPKSTWSDGGRYDAAARKLAKMFRDNFEQFAAQVTEDVRGSGPQA